MPGSAGFAGGSTAHDASTNAAKVEKAVAAIGLLYLGMGYIDAPVRGPMATATSPKQPKPTASRLKTVRNVVLVLLAIALLWLIWNWSSIKGQAQLGASYGAHVACSCRYIESRDLKSCETDFEPGMELVSLSDDPANKRVTASILFLAEAVAERRSDFGCLQLNEAEIDAL